MPLLDQWSAPAAVALEQSLIFSIFRWITELGSGSFLIPFTVAFAIGLWIYTKDWLASIMCIAGLLLGYKANFWIKYVVARERPRILAEAEGVGYSFPSGHAMVSLITYGVMIYFLVSYVRSTSIAVSIHVIGILLILFIGMSRYIIRVHYLSDVLAGYAFGAVFLILWISLYQLIRKWQT